MDARTAFLTVQDATAEVERQEKMVEEARKDLERQAERLKAAKLSLATAWSTLERVTNHAQLYSVDGVVYMRWVGHNGYPEPKLVPVNGFVIPPVEAAPAQ